MEQMYKRFMDFAKDFFNKSYASCSDKCEGCPFNKDAHDTGYDICSIISNFYDDNRED